MSTDHTSAAVRSGWSLGRSMLSVGLAVSALAVAATGALFTASTSVGDNTFATGDVDLSTSSATQVVANAKMAPGDVETGSVTVTNSGSLELRYAMTSTTDEDTLAAQIDMTVWDEDAEGDGTDGGDGTCADTAPAEGALYGPDDLGSTSTPAIIGDTTQGQQTGDQVLAGAADQLLCFRAELPTSSGNTFQSLSTTATFAFEAEQTTNNA